MEDEKIVELLYVHENNSLEEVANKYGSMIYNISNRILNDEQDAQECVNDTYMKIWNTIPPYKPNFLKSFICKIVRQISIDKYRGNKAQKRDGSYDVPLLDLDYEIIDNHSIENELESKALSDCINEYVKSLNIENQTLFIRRYFLAESIKELSKRFEMNENIVAVKLFRIRKDLIKYLKREEYEIEKI